MKNRRIVYLVCVTFVFLSGCVIPNWNGYGSVDLSVNWGELSNDHWSKGYSVNFYNQADGMHIPDSSTNSDQLYDKQLKQGNYNLLSYSMDDLDIKIRDITSYEAASAIIAPLSSKTKSSIMTIGQPTSFYFFDNGAIPINVSATAGVPIKMMPKNYVREVEVTINLTGDASLVASAEMTLSGIANGINLLTGVPFSDTGKKNIVTLLDISPDDMMVTSLYVFGAAARAEGEPIHNEFIIELFFSDDGTQKIREDVTLQMGGLADLKSEKKIEIVVDILITQEVGAQIGATVLEWVTVLVPKIYLDKV